MISLIASPDQIVDDCVTYITLNFDDELNKKQYQGLYINLIIKKVGTTTNQSKILPSHFKKSKNS